MLKYKPTMGKMVGGLSLRVNRKERRTMKRLMMIAVAAVAAIATAMADTIDLNGESATATLLTDDTIYVNSSATTASLVFDCSDDVTFDGTIEGNIALVKQGAGKLALNGHNTYTGGTFVSNGWLTVGADWQVAGGAVSLAGGNLRIAANYTPSTVCFTLDADATVDTRTFRFGVGPATFITKGRTMTKTGSGSIAISGSFTDTQAKGATWVVQEGFISGASDPFGGHTSKTDMTLEVHEGAYILSDGHVPIPSRLVLRGGELRSSANRFTSAVATYKWKTFSLNHTITVLPSLDGRPSVVNALAVHMGNAATLVPTFDVRESAELQMNTAMVEGRTGNADSAPLTAGSFVKKGAGTLAVMQPGTLKGLVRLEEGTLRFGKGGGLGKDATLVARAGTKVSLDDGAVIDCNYCGNSLMSSAEVWIDATKFAATDGSTVSSIPNLGTCGGSFNRFASRTSTMAAAPTYKADAINGRPAFSFNGHQALGLDTYTNITSQITIFVVARCTHWEDSGNKGKWAAVLAGHSTTDGNTDDVASGAFYQNDNGAYTWLAGNGNRKGISLSSHSQIIAGTPFIDCLRRNGTSANLMQYLYGSDTAGSASRNDYPDTPMNVNRLGLCCRLGPNASCEYWGDTHTSSRLWYGDVGEVLVFSRSLSDGERAAVNEYLREKWHNTTNSAVSVDALYSGRRDEIDVPAGAASLVTARTEEGALTKTGAGTLRVNAMSNRQDVRVAEGTLELLPTSVVAHIDVWMDAADESVVKTNADGRIATLRNKGNAGGVFAASPSPRSATYGAPTPVWESGAINGLRGLKFAGDSALVLDSYVNTNKHGFLTVFMVAERSPDIQFGVAGRGKWSAPFSMVSTANSVPDDKQDGAFHYDEKADGETAVPYGQFYAKGDDIAKADNITNSVPNGAAFILTCYLEGYNQYYNFETYASAEAKKVTRTVWRYCDFNRVQLGCRLDAYGRTPLYGVGNSASRAWYGRIGEFIVCTAPLSDAEKAEITGYLRKKWMNKGDGSASAPSVLTGAALAGSLGADTALTLAQGATVSSGAATQPIASLAASGAATLARSGVTDPEGYSMFSIGGDVTLPAAMTFRADDLPTDDANIFTYVGTISPGTQWSVVSEKSGPHMMDVLGAVRLIRHYGFILHFR